jgi:membrane-associated phospholipid phosphatase
MPFKKFLQTLEAHDVTILAFGVLLSGLNVLFSYAIPQWYLLIVANIIVSFLIIMLAYYNTKNPNPILSAGHFWYVAPIIVLTYKELYFMIHPIHGRDYDGLFILIDRWLFGVDPTVWLAQFAHPLLTEVLQIAYASFYFLLIIIGYELYRKKERVAYLYYAFLVVYGFYLSYVGYFFFPAVGPRFTLHNFDTINDELPGLLLTNFLRDFVNLGESILPGVPNPVEHAQRDVFPSGHTMIMLVMMHVAVQYRMKVKWFILVMGTLLIIGTMYLRYHYVIDVVAGAAFYFLCMWTAPRVFAWWQRVKDFSKVL